MRKPSNVESAFAKYTIHKQLGQGGAGKVYSASDKLGNNYAIKFLTNVTTDKLQRFKNEYGFCCKNTHKNIIKMFDYGLYYDPKQDKYPFVVMDLYECSLREKMGQLKPVQAYESFIKILNGVEAAHLKNVIHRDIKPENILVDDSVAHLVVADFGIAHFHEEELYTIVETRPNTRLANFQYAAPEQKERNANVDQRADIFALGLLLNELFTGQVPHGTSYSKIEGIAPEFAFLDPIVEKMTCQKTEDRFPNIDEIKKELISLKQQQISRQKLSALDKKVIEKTDVEDPLIADPVKILDVDWDDGTLTLKFNHDINNDWIWALNNMGSYSSLMGKGPEKFSFRFNKASISTRADEAQNMIDYFKDWLPKANRKYELKLKHDIEIKEKKERIALQQKKGAEQQRLNVLKNLKF
jgi:eukaryotic-like serine/threonine-protein kinase